MALKTEVLDLVTAAINELNDEWKIAALKQVSESTPIFGTTSEIDSLKLVNLIVMVEQQVNDKYDTTISLSDEKAFSQKRSPFQTVNSLAEYIITTLAAVGK